MRHRVNLAVINVDGATSQNSSKKSYRKAGMI